MEEFIIKDGKRLRCGYTTGSCAAAAAAAAAQMLLEGTEPEQVTIALPKGKSLCLKVHNRQKGSDFAICSILKDAGDDPDITNGAEICATVRWHATIGICVDGGQGVGRVTKAGLACKVGEAAINPIPHRMIVQNVQAVLAAHQGIQTKGLHVLITVPQGEELAQKTFNSNLGIVGGISIIGTTGIVEPMSEKALTDSIRLELQVLRATGAKALVAVAGNYGQSFLQNNLGYSGTAVKYSNYLGELVADAAELGFAELLIVGHMGKLMKAAGGMLNTHSNNGDFRMELMVCYAALQGIAGERLQSLFDCATTEAAMNLLQGWGVSSIVAEQILAKAIQQIRKKAGEGLAVEAILFTNTHGVVAQTQGAAQQLGKLL